MKVNRENRVIIICVSVLGVVLAVIMLLCQRNIEPLTVLSGMKLDLESSNISGADLRGYAGEVARIHRETGREGLRMLDDLRNEKIGQDMVERLFDACKFEPEIDAFDFSVPTGVEDSVVVIITVKRFESERRRVMIIVLHEIPLDYGLKYLNRFERYITFSGNVFLGYSP